MKQSISYSSGYMKLLGKSIQALLCNCIFASYHFEVISKNFTFRYKHKICGLLDIKLIELIDVDLSTYHGTLHNLV